MRADSAWLQLATYTMTQLSFTASFNAIGNNAAKSALLANTVDCALGTSWLSFTFRLSTRSCADDAAADCE